jgi:hypothetical protein
VCVGRVFGAGGREMRWNEMRYSGKLSVSVSEGTVVPYAAGACKSDVIPSVGEKQRKVVLNHNSCDYYPTF